MSAGWVALYGGVVTLEGRGAFDISLFGVGLFGVGLFGVGLSQVGRAHFEMVQYADALRAFELAQQARPPSLLPPPSAHHHHPICHVCR